MDKRRVKVFRDKLLNRRESLVGQVQQAELYSRERDAEATQDPADMAANAYTKELLVSMSDNDRQLLNLIDEALERIEDGDYGKCVRCGEVLPDKRLDAVPWARHCMRCQDLHERGLLSEDED
ncbi:MAG TPA: TraR/DksA family transcriptional regulator [Pyrinomonadaceae bacterium]|nr:TraR/DksA family transcriptional regulator [Pyrinomonadaceae bacterium]